MMKTGVFWWDILNALQPLVDVGLGLGSGDEGKVARGRLKIHPSAVMKSSSRSARSPAKSILRGGRNRKV